MLQWVHETEQIDSRENERKQITISVRNLVEFLLLRSGDIEEGQGKMHDSWRRCSKEEKFIGNFRRKRDLSYHAEVPLKI